MTLRLSYDRLHEMGACIDALQAWRDTFGDLADVPVTVPNARRFFNHCASGDHRPMVSWMYWLVSTVTTLDPVFDSNRDYHTALRERPNQELVRPDGTTGHASLSTDERWQAQDWMMVLFLLGVYCACMGEELYP